jgi:hypothetical protein
VPINVVYFLSLMFFYKEYSREDVAVELLGLLCEMFGFGKVLCIIMTCGKGQQH